MGLTTAGRDHRGDAEATYLHTFDSFSTDPSEVAQALDINVRYARELLGLLVDLGIVCEGEVNDQDLVWQCVDTYDNTTREAAEDQFNAVWDLRAKITPELVAAPKAPTGTDCRCGCGERTNKKALYRPGHDARHAGQVARLALTDDGMAALEAGVATLPSQKLKDKALAMAERLVAKATATPARPAVTKGAVRVGRHELRAQRNEATGEILYLRGKDNQWVLAIARIAKTFTPKA